METIAMLARLLRLFFAQKKHYKSPIQKFLDKFDKQTPLSKSQKAEIDKYKLISKLRDNPNIYYKKNNNWLDQDNIE